MKTRIISATVMIAIVIGALTAGKLCSPLIITAFVAALAAMGIYELSSNAMGVKKPSVIITACVYGAVMVFLLDKNFRALFETPKFLEILKTAPFCFTVLYFLIAVFYVLYFHKDFELHKILGITAYPLIISYAFSCLAGIILFDKGIYYLLLLVNFSSVCDTGAYFVGSFFGKHKLCPEISPKKTVEGAVGGIVSSLVVSVVLAFFFGDKGHLAVTLIATVLLCIVGIMGDLFASVIKRSVALKDYSNLIPGHGGILDRFDSMLLIAPVLYAFMTLGAI